MKKRNLPKNSKREKIRRERDPVPWRYCLLTLVCGVLLVGGFFLAARSHFSSIDFGIKNSSLKKQIEELEADKRRLLLAKEVALSPGEIKKAAKKLGLTDMTASNIETFRVSDGKPAKPAAVKAPEAKTSEKPAEKAPEIKKDDKSGKTGPLKDKPVTIKKEPKPSAQIAKR